MPSWTSLMVFSVLLILSTCTFVCWASKGDRSVEYIQCVRWCYNVYCAAGKYADYERNMPWYMRWLWWTCFDNCKYECTWTASMAFQSKNLSIPQFFGKWPFVRWAGIQEPASTVFSIMNGLAVIWGLKRFRAKVPSSAPMYYVYHLHGLVACNAWLWSTVFHTRDVIITETLDYVCAVLLVAFSLYTCLHRIFLRVPWVRALFGLGTFLFALNHVFRMLFIRFDYGYNMKVNVTMGTLNGVITLAFANYEQKRKPFVWKIAATVVITFLLLMLELFDFPPFFWVFDAHSLWHAGTSPVALLFYSFCTDDCLMHLKEAGTPEQLNNNLLLPKTNDDTLVETKED